MKNKNLYLLLEIILNKGDARRLVMEGLDYKEIGELTTLALQEELILFDNNTLILSTKGTDRYNADLKTFKKVNKDEWILPDNKSRISKIDKNTIFLPRQDELTF